MITLKSLRTKSPLIWSLIKKQKILKRLILMFLISYKIIMSKSLFSRIVKFVIKSKFNSNNFYKFIKGSIYTQKMSLISFLRQISMILIIM